MIALVLWDLHLPSKEDEFRLSKEVVTIHNPWNIQICQQMISLWYIRKSFGVRQIQAKMPALFFTKLDNILSPNFLIRTIEITKPTPKGVEKVNKKQHWDGR